MKRIIILIHIYTKHTINYIIVRIYFSYKFTVTYDIQFTNTMSLWLRLQRIILPNLYFQAWSKIVLTIKL